MISTRPPPTWTTTTTAFQPPFSSARDVTHSHASDHVLLFFSPTPTKVFTRPTLFSPLSSSKLKQKEKLTRVLVKSVTCRVDFVTCLWAIRCSLHARSACLVTTMDTSTCFRRLTWKNSIPEIWMIPDLRSMRRRRHPHPHHYHHHRTKSTRSPRRLTS